jgi:hypothetical protein
VDFIRAVFLKHTHLSAELNVAVNYYAGKSTSLCQASASVDSLKNFFRMTKLTMIAAKAATTSRTGNNTETLRRGGFIL